MCRRISRSSSASGWARKCSASGVLCGSGNSVVIKAAPVGKSGMPAMFACPGRPVESPKPQIPAQTRRLMLFLDWPPLVAAIRVAAGAFQGHPVMLAEGADRVTLFGIGVGVAGPDDDRAEAAIVAPVGRQHRGGERIAVAVAQGQEQRHLVLDMRFQPDLLLEKDLGNGPKALRRFVMLLAEILLDGVAHKLGFGQRLGFGLDPKPCLAAWGVANVPHASSPR